MQHQHIDETQIMEENLQKLIKNQNYFSCFIQNQKHQEEPTNPFQKRLFDKNLRRSAISCGHYSSSHQQNSNLEQDTSRINSSRRNSLKNHEININNNYNHNYPTLSSTNFYAQMISQPLTQTSHQKVSLAQSRHSDPVKNQITQIINNFRLELDYLEQKLHHKVEQLNCRYGDRECNQKQREAEFMIESLQKIVGFMVENCVNLEDSVMYGDRTQQENTGRRSEIMRKEVYEIEQEEHQQENMSFSNCGNDRVELFKPTHRFGCGNEGGNTGKKSLKDNGVSGKKRKIVGMIEKENVNSGNNQEQENLPQTYYINNKLHSNIQNSTNKPSKPTLHQPTTRTSHQQSSKPTKRAPSRNSNKKPTQPTSQNEPYHFHSSKQTINSHSQYNSTSHNESNHGAKSIYETVLEEREMKMKMKKKIV